MRSYPKMIYSYQNTICMKIYVNISDLIAELHDSGFDRDFDVRTDGILLVQENSLLSDEDFFITECHRFLNSQGNEMDVCAIVAPNYFAKGILILHDNLTCVRCYTMLQKKIDLLSCKVEDNHDEFGYQHSSDM